MKRALVLLSCVLIALFVLQFQWFLLVPLPFLVLGCLLFSGFRLVFIPTVLLTWFAYLTVRHWEPNLLIEAALIPETLMLVWLLESF